MGKQTNRTVSDVVGIAVLTTLYFGAGKLGLSLAVVHHSSSPVWPPTGLSLAALLLFGPRLWPGVWLGAFLVNATSDGLLPTDLCIATGNTLEALLGWWLVQRLAHGRDTFERAGDIFRYSWLAAVLATSVSATIGVSSLVLTGTAQIERFVPIWSTWWLGDMVSALVLTPLIVIWGKPPQPAWNRPQLVEMMLAVTLTALVALVVFGGILPPPFTSYPTAFLCIPPLVWAGFRFGQRGAVATLFVLAMVAIPGNLHGLGPFAVADRNDSLLLMQAFLGVIGVTNLVLGAVASERRAAEAAVRQSIADLRRAKEDQAYLAAIVTSSHDAIISKTLTGIVTSWNQAAQRMFGYTAAEMISQSIHRIIPQELWSEETEILARLRTGQRLENYETVRVRKDGRQLPVALTISPIRDPDGTVIGASKIARDITERKQAEAERAAWQRDLEHRVRERTSELVTAHERLRAEIDERKRLEAEVACAIEREQRRLGQELHEGLGQQLTAIGYLMTALQGKLGNGSSPYGRDLNRLQQMLRETVSGTRDLAHGFYPVDLERYGLLMALEELTARHANPDGVTYSLESDGDPSCTEVRGPLAIQLFRIAQEAVQNALQHAHARQIAIRLARLDETIQLRITDDGVGLPADRAPNQGLGLRIMQYRAGMVGGQVELHNAPNHGLVVTCTVPAAAAAVVA